MKQLNKIQSGLFLLGGLLMVAGAGCFVFLWQQTIVCWIFLIGATLFSSMQSIQTYDGPDQTIRRLKRLRDFASLLFVISGLLMVDSAFHLSQSLFSNVVDYFTYVYNKWIVALLAAAIIEVYTVHRLDHELSKKS